MSGPSAGNNSGVRPPVLSTRAVRAKHKNRLAFLSTLFENARRIASVSPEKRVAMAVRSYELI
jgi:hypothetical protein